MSAAGQAISDWPMGSFADVVHIVRLTCTWRLSPPSSTHETLMLIRPVRDLTQSWSYQYVAFSETQHDCCQAAGVAAQPDPPQHKPTTHFRWPWRVLVGAALWVV